METLLGIRVYNERDTAVSKAIGWQNILPYFVRLKRKYTNKGDFEAHVRSRLEQPAKGWKIVDDLLETLYEGRKIPIASLRELKVKLTIGEGCYLKHVPYKQKNIKQLSDLKVTGGVYGAPITAALECREFGCKAYQDEIFSLLQPCGNTEINGGFSTKKQEWGQDVLPEKVKAYTVKPEREPNMDVVIRLRFAAPNYKTDTSHSRHAEILSGILFEAGNVYIRNFGGRASQIREAHVTCHNVRQVARIAKKNYPITQNDWRNLMQLLFETKVKTETFQCTGDYISAFRGGKHDVGGSFQITY